MDAFHVRVAAAVAATNDANANPVVGADRPAPGGSSDGRGEIRCGSDAAGSF